MFLHIARVILILLEVLVLFNLLIVVHELGHFLAARWRGLYIEKFGVWFGKPLWKKTINGVQYSLGSLPFGGFVALPQLAPMDIIEGKADVDRAKLAPISALDKIIVAVAGPLFSLLLALCFAGIVWVVGHPVGESDSTTIIGYVMPDSREMDVPIQERRDRDFVGCVHHCGQRAASLARASREIERRKIVVARNFKF